MNWNDFYQSIEDGRMAPVYLFTGPEQYVKAEALQRLRAALLPVGLEVLNETVLEGVTAQRITVPSRTVENLLPARGVFFAFAFVSFSFSNDVSCPSFMKKAPLPFIHFRSGL